MILIFQMAFLLKPCHFRNNWISFSIFFGEFLSYSFEEYDTKDLS